MRFSNCLIWAITQWVKKGGYIAFRRGVQFGGWYCHFLWSPDMRKWYSYHPIKDKNFPWLLFRGKILEGDDMQKLQKLPEGLGNSD